MKVQLLLAYSVNVSWSQLEMGGRDEYKGQGADDTL